MEVSEEAEVQVGKTAVDTEKPIGSERLLGGGTDGLDGVCLKKKNQGKRVGFVPETAGGWLDH